MHNFVIETGQSLKINIRALFLTESEVLIKQHEMDKNSERLFVFNVIQELETYLRRIGT